MEVILEPSSWPLDMAVSEAKRSNCQSQRGVIIWHQHLGLMASGHNRPPLPFVCDGSDECRKHCSKTAVHAEQNAILNFTEKKFTGVSLSDCEMLHIKVVDGMPVPSGGPSCWQCSKLILQAKIKKMWLYTVDGLVGYTAEEFHKETLKNCGLSE